MLEAMFTMTLQKQLYNPDGLLADNPLYNIIVSDKVGNNVIIPEMICKDFTKLYEKLVKDNEW